MTTFWMVLLVILFLGAVCAALTVGPILMLDGRPLVGAGLLVAGMLAAAWGIAAMIDADAEDGRVCVRNHVVIIGKAPYTVCDEYAERVK